MSHGTLTSCQLFLSLHLHAMLCYTSIMSIIFPEINCYYNQKPEPKLQCNRYPYNCLVVIICFSASSLDCNSNVSFLLLACHWLTSSIGLSGAKILLPFPYQQVQDFLDSIHKRKLIAMEYPDFLQLKHSNKLYKLGQFPRKLPHG